MCGTGVSMKWPNDLMIDGRKLGGILVERGSGWVVAGIGVNAGATPAGEALHDGVAPLAPFGLCHKNILLFTNSF